MSRVASSLFLGSLIFLVLGQVSAQTTEIVYQGQLQSTGTPANGTFDMEFALFDLVGGGSQVGATLTRSGVAVNNGIFSVNLDFGSSFPGATRFLEIRVRAAGGGSFNTLSPRQVVTSSPYSIKSLNSDNAASAATATNATNAANAQNAVTFSGTLNGDVTGTQGSTSVERVRGRTVSATQPNNGQVLKFNTTTSQWEPATDETGSGGGGGTITGVTAGTGLTGGGTSGNVTLSIANGGVGTLQIADSSVTDAKIATVSGAKITGTVASANNAAQLGGISASGFIQNTLNQQPTSNFNISGTGSGNVLNAATQYELGGNRILSNPGTNSLFVGVQAGNANPSGPRNSFFGTSAGSLTSTGDDNTFIGSSAGLLTSSGSDNTFVGSSTGLLNNGGSRNSFFGFGAGGGNSSGTDNSFVGASSGQGNANGSNNSTFEAGADVSAGNLNFATAIGAGSSATSSNSVTLGRAADTVRVPGNLLVSGVLTANIDGAGITNLNASNIASGTLNNARLGIVGIANGGTGSATQNFVDLTTAQTIGGNKTFSNTLSAPIVNATGQYNLGGSRIVGSAGTGNLFAGIGAGAVNSGGLNTFVGRDAGNANTTGFRNTFLGSSAGSSNTSGQNLTFVGDGAGEANTASLNTFVGASSGRANTTGSGNAFFGRDAGVSNLGGSSNTFLGDNSGRNNLDGVQNTFVGASAGSGVTGSSNTIVGHASGGANTTGGSNTLIGRLAGSSLSTGANNSMIGVDSGLGTTTGSSNSFVGDDAGNSNVGGSNNSAFGAGADMLSSGLTFATAIGAGSTVSGSSTIALGRSSGDDTVRIPGRLALLDLGTAGSTQLCRNGLITGPQIATCSSSLRYKDNIQSFGLGLDLIRQLRPITFDWKQDGMKDLGLGAEDVAAIEPLLVTYNSKNEVEGVKYDRISVVMINALKEQQKQIELQAGTIEYQGRRIEKQQKEIDGLKNALCSIARDADICRQP